MKTFIEEYGVIIVASIAILALVAIATATSTELGEQISTVIDSFTGAMGEASLDVKFE
ncbi:MAG: hypothetical protein R3Y40_04080 [Eubacteriales bacterium]